MGRYRFLISPGSVSNWTMIRSREAVKFMKNSPTENVMMKQRCANTLIQTGHVFCRGGEFFLGADFGSAPFVRCRLRQPRGLCADRSSYFQRACGTRAEMGNN